MQQLIVIAFLLLTILGVSDALAQQKTAVQKSYLQARDVLDAGLRAMGGVRELQNINDISREMSGIRSDEGQGAKPVWPRLPEPPPISRRHVKSVRDIKGNRVYDEIDDVIFGGQPLKIRTALAGNVAFSVSETSKNIFIVPQAAINNVRARWFRRYPESLLVNAWLRQETLRWIGEAEFDGRKQSVISFSDTDGTQVALYFDNVSHLISKTEVPVDDQILGDVVAETVYSDWRPLEKSILPFRYTDRLADSVQQDLRATSITLNSHPPDSLFAMPEGYGKIGLPPQPPVVKKLADDVYVALGEYNSLFVTFNDYILVVEGGGNNRATSAAIAEIKKLVPNKPIRYLVSTHFHFDHLSGVRSYVAEGATIVTTPTAKSIIEQAVKATHIMRPDALSRNPKPAAIESMTDTKRVFDDGTHRVELYRFKSPHVDEMVVAYLPKDKVLFEADMFDIPEAGNPTPGDDTVDLAAQIESLGLKVETIIPVHGRIGDIADLKQAVTRKTGNETRAN